MVYAYANPNSFSTQRMENEYLKYYAQYAISTNLTKPNRLNQKNRQKAVF